MKEDKIILDRISKVKKWIIMNSSCVSYIIGYGFKQWTKGVKDTYPNNRLISFCGGRFTKSGSETQFLADEQEYYDSAKKLFDGKDLERFYKDFEKAEKKFCKIYEQIEENGEEYLEAHYKEFIQAYDEEYIVGVIPDGILVYGEHLIAELKEKYPEYHKEIEIMLNPYGETFVARYEYALLNLALKTKLKKLTSKELLSNNESKKDLEKLQKEFHWMLNNYKKAEPLSVSHFAEQLAKTLEKDESEIKKELESIKKRVPQQRKEVELIEKSKKFAEEDFYKLFWLGKFAWMIDRRKEYNLKANYIINRHLISLVKKYKLNYDDAVLLLPWELDKVISGKKKISDFNVEERKKEGLFFYDEDGNQLFIYGDEGRKVWAEINKADLKKEVNEIKGTPAFRGKVVGKAKIMMDAHSDKKFQDGEILVTGMTTPEYVPAMKKAGAIVTDEGGLTCHAAIVARELGIPCVVGTKNATRILKDDMIVEIHASTGVVKILKEANH